jgi:hypothetical protein
MPVSVTLSSMALTAVKSVQKAAKIVCRHRMMNSTRHFLVWQIWWSNTALCAWLWSKIPMTCSTEQPQRRTPIMYLDRLEDYYVEWVCRPCTDQIVAWTNENPIVEMLLRSRCKVVVDKTKKQAFLGGTTLRMATLSPNIINQRYPLNTRGTAAPRPYRAGVPSSCRTFLPQRHQLAGYMRGWRGFCQARGWAKCSYSSLAKFAWCWAKSRSSPQRFDLNVFDEHDII